MSATYVIQIQANASSVPSVTQKVGQDLDKIKQKALDTNAAIRQIFGIYAIKEILVGIEHLTNNYQQIENKIRTVTDSQANLNGVMGETYKIAQDTRTAWDSTITIYQRLALNSKALGASQRDLLDFTKRLNEEIIVSGATTKEASAGVIQLAQGMAAGRLHGQDLRAVMEDLPGVGDIIAKHFNVTRGALYDLGKQGKITSTEIIAAFKEAGDSIDTNFNKTVPTMSQGLVMVENAAEKFFGEMGTGSGILSDIGRILGFVADHFETIGKIIIVVTQTLGGLYIITKIIGWFQALAAVIAANPFTAFATVVVGAVLALRQFGDEISSAGNSAVSIGDQLRALWEMFKQVTSAIGEFISEGWNELKAAFSDGVSLDGIDLTLGNAIKLFAAFVLSVKSIIEHLRDIMVDIFGGIPAVLAEKFDESFHSLVMGIEGIVNKIIKAINAIHNLTDNSVQDNFDKAQVIQKKIDAIDEQINAAQSVYKGPIQFYKTPFGTSTTAYYQSPGNDYTDKLSMDRVAELTKQRDALAKQQAPLLAAITGHKDTDLIPELQFDSEGVKGASTALGKSLKNIADDIRSDVVLGLAEFDKLSKEISDKRLANKPGSVIHDEHGAAAIPPPTPAEIAAYNKLVNELDGLIKKGTPYEAAMQKIADANKILDNPQAEGILEKVFGTNAAAVLDGIKERLKPITDMFDEMIRKTIDRTAAMRGSREEEELNLAVEQELEKLRANGTEATQSQANEIRRVTALAQERNRVWREEQKILDEVKGPEKEYVLALEAINKALKDQEINQHQANMAREQAARALLSSSAGNMSFGDLAKTTRESIDPDALTHGFKNGLSQVMQQMLDLSNTVSNAMNATFQSLEKNILQAVETGKFAWDDLANTAVQELNKVALKILETWLLTTILNAALGNPTGAVASIPGINAPITSPSQLPDGGSHATGGSYVYPGNGGLDSRSVMFRMTPGERVDFTPPGRTPTSMAAEAGRKGGQSTHGGRSGIQMVMIDGRSIIPALSTPEGQRAIMQVIIDNPEIVRGIKR